MKKTFNLKLSKKEVAVLDHGRFKGMVDVLNIIEKRINKKMDEGEKVEVSTLVTEILAHKLQAQKMLNKSSENLSKFSEETEEKETKPKK